METKRIGINYPIYNPDEITVRKDLLYLQSCGFDCIELSLDSVPLIIGGEMNIHFAKYLENILYDMPFAYSAHSSGKLDLRSSAKISLHEKVLFSSIDVCQRFGCSPLVIHFEEDSRISSVEREFLSIHAKAARYAAQCGVLLCIENIEVERIDPVLEFIRKVNDANLQMTLDVGHAYLASRYFGEDFLEVLSMAKPYIGHVHLSDNTGDFEETRISNREAYDAMPISSRITFGQGDIHLPPFWGSIPYHDVFEILKGFPGKYICEFPANTFKPFLIETAQDLRELIGL
ncbi:MAG: sugar phosphate isomerase/epimerase [Candidatus Latescibacteria bacterium]|nr:sugar phosphate isomerase/epimerase [Candidatus Latescibacterota bacterium]